MKLGLLACTGLGFAVGMIFYPKFIGESQPIEFNHKIHIEKVGIDCEICHSSAKEGLKGGLPKLEVCLECHSEAQTKSHEEQKLMELSKQKKEIHWVPFTEIPTNAYFSHRRHVSLGKIECEVCHGKIAQKTNPPRHALVSMKMNNCLSCHKKKKVETDCLTCHK